MRLCQFKDCAQAHRTIEVPMQIVAADFWKRRQVVFDSGELRPAIHASMALPGIFAPAVIDGRVLVDGGVINPVPFDLLDDCDFVIAVNVMGRRTESKPSSLSQGRHRTISCGPRPLMVSRKCSTCWARR